MRNIFAEIFTTYYRSRGQALAELELENLSLAELKFPDLANQPGAFMLSLILSTSLYFAFCKPYTRAGTSLCLIFHHSSYGKPGPGCPWLVFLKALLSTWCGQDPKNVTRFCFPSTKTCWRPTRCVWSFLLTQCGADDGMLTASNPRKNLGVQNKLRQVA